MSCFGLRNVIEAEGAEVGDLEFFGDCSVGFLLFEDGSDELFEVGIERSWDSFEAGLMEILSAKFVFEGEELFAVRGCGGEGGVVEREEERVDVWHPTKAWWLDTGAHGDTVGEHDADVGFVEDVGGVVASLLLAKVFSCYLELCETCCVERRLPVEVEDGLPRIVKSLQIGARADGVGVRLHGVDGEGVEVAVIGVGRGREHGVRVIVDGWNGGDLRGESGVDGEFARLCEGLGAGGQKEGECFEESAAARAHRL